MAIQGELNKLKITVIAEDSVLYESPYLGSMVSHSSSPQKETVSEKTSSWMWHKIQQLF